MQPCLFADIRPDNTAPPRAKGDSPALPKSPARSNVHGHRRVERQTAYVTSTTPWGDTLRSVWCDVYAADVRRLLDEDCLIVSFLNRNTIHYVRHPRRLGVLTGNVAPFAAPEWDE